MSEGVVAPVVAIVTVNGPLATDQALSSPDSKRADDKESFYGENACAFEVDSQVELNYRFYEPPDTYEGKKRWDPKAEWTEEEETKLRRKLDWKVMSFACLCFFALQLDRGNLGNAVSDDMLTDVGMTTANYNIGNTIFSLCFLFAELPSQMISKKLGSDVWIPIQMMSWSAVAMGQMGINGPQSFYATRALLGLIEGGCAFPLVRAVVLTIIPFFLPIESFYTATELTIRLSYFWCALTTTTIISGFLAAGLLQMRGMFTSSHRLFLIEGTITFLVGLWAAFYLPASPTQTAKWWRKEGWFTEREETIIVNKVLRDDPFKSDMHNREGLSLKQFWESLCDYDLWPLYALGITSFVAPNTISTYYTLTLKALKFTTFQTNLMTIPGNVISIIFTLIPAYISKRVNERLIIASFNPIWMLPFIIGLIYAPDDLNRWVRWVLITLTVSHPSSHPIIVSMNSGNAGSVRTRTVASSLYNMFVQSASLISSNVYQPPDAPYYHKGNKVLAGITGVAIFNFWAAKAWYIYRNKQKAKVWDTYTAEEKGEYMKSTSDKGNKRLDFRFLH
ncbi:hypothetical protein I350_05847 [Cryptococcus amylolentus CBS 6273]|uniref:Major facilitator superfamily (MFS) profile domain-containing protein n=1 Tax=Cryptococcus amylolentus CBS 6273 TaxID=1296118 RepID=A0A1E3JQA1_9TREE|nr:hypothetical protein I350_05847 [Cryptococcus amylolentus CBS 6273]